MNFDCLQMLLGCLGFAAGVVHDGPSRGPVEKCVDHEQKRILSLMMAQIVPSTKWMRAWHFMWVQRNGISAFFIPLPSFGSFIRCPSSTCTHCCISGTYLLVGNSPKWKELLWQVRGLRKRVPATMVRNRRKGRPLSDSFGSFVKDYKFVKAFQPPCIWINWLVFHGSSCGFEHHWNVVFQLKECWKSNW